MASLPESAVPNMWTYFYPDIGFDPHPEDFPEVEVIEVTYEILNDCERSSTKTDSDH